MSQLNGNAAAIALLNTNHITVHQRGKGRVELRYRPPSFQRALSIGRADNLFDACHDALASDTIDPATDEIVALPIQALMLAALLSDDVEFVFGALAQLFPEAFLEDDDPEDTDEQESASTAGGPQGEVYEGDFGGKRRVRQRES